MKKNAVYVAGLLGLFAVAPLVVLAQTLNKTGTIIFNAGTIINMLIGICAALALLVFFWGIVKYIASAGDADKAKEGKSIMIYGVIALFVLFSVFGLVWYLRYEFGVLQNSDLTAPKVRM